jgi:hypothetical protein
MSPKRSFLRENWWLLPGVALLAFGLAVQTRWTVRLVAQGVLLWLALFVALFGLVAGAMILRNLWKNRGKPRPRPDPRATLDDRGVRFGRPGEERTVPWDAIVSLSLYYGEPDFPDPLVGNAWVREWRFRGRDGLLEIDGYFLDARELSRWAARKLPGFDARAAWAAWDSESGGHTVLWSAAAPA